jgi:hypothetical protein
MIISYHRNFIYIRTRKTASSTIEGILKQHLGPDDLFVGKGQIRKPRSGGRRTNKTKVEAANGETPDDVSGHMNAAQIKSLVSDDFWNSCFKFTSERHPYEKAVSLANFNFGRLRSHGKAEGHDLSSFLDRVLESGRYRSFDLYSINGGVVVDDFIRYESLQADIRRICDRLGIALPDELPRKSTAAYAIKQPAKDILSDSQKLRIFNRCREEFELLGYEP